MDFAFRSQYFSNEPGFKGNKPKEVTVAFQKRNNFINEWTDECHIHLKQIEEEFQSKEINSPSSEDIDFLLKEKMQSFSPKIADI